MTQARIVELETADLTPSGEVYCPHPKADMKIWNTHPRIFMPLDNDQAKCPYCGTVYQASADKTAQNSP